MEEQRLAVVAAEDEEDLQQQLVAAVSEHELIRRRAPARGEHLAELVAAARVAVKDDAVKLVRAQISGDRVRLRPLVGVDPNVRFQHLRAVWLELRQLSPGSRQLSLGHRQLA